MQRSKDGLKRDTDKQFDFWFSQISDSLETNE